MSKNLLVIAKLVAKPGEAENLQRVLTACVAPSRAEAGNIHYDLYRSTEDQNTFLFHETWQDVAAIELHEKTAHFLQLTAEAASLLAKAPEVTKL